MLNDSKVNASALARTNHQTAPQHDHHCPGVVVQSTERRHWLRSYYLRGHWRKDDGFPDPAPAPVQYWRRQHQA